MSTSIESRPEADTAGTRRLAPKRTSHGSARRGLRRLLLPLILLTLLVILVVLPLALIVLSSFTTETPRPGNISLEGLTFENYASLFSAGVGQAAVNSLMVGAGSSLIALITGGFLAFITARSNVQARRFLYFVGFLPMLLPSYVGALAWAILGAPNSGLMNVLARDLGLDNIVNVYGIYGLIFVLGIYYAPYAFLLIHSSFSLMNPDLEEAAGVHGASLSKIMRRVTFPLATPAILGSLILVFTLTVENFPVAQIIGGAAGLDTLPTYIYRLMNSAPSRGNEAAAVAICLILVVLVVTMLQRKMLAKRSFTTVSGKGIKPRKVNLGKFRLPALLFGLLYFLLSAVLPMLALLTVALHDSPFISTMTRLFEPGVLSLESFTESLTSNIVMKAALNSIIAGVAAALVGTVLCFVLAYVVNRTTLPGRQILEYVTMMPLAVPSIVLGLGLLWTWLIMPLPLYGTLLLMVIAFTAAQLPQGFRGISGSILQIDRDLEDSAVMHGANRARAVSKVTLPLMRVGLTSTFLLLLMLSMRELTVPLFLFTTDTRLLSIVIFDDFDNGILQRATAISILYCVVLLFISLLARRFGAKQED